MGIAVIRFHGTTRWVRLGTSWIGLSLAAVVLVAQAADGNIASLVPIPVPNLEREEQAVREQLLRERAAFDQLLAEPTSTSEEVALAMGELGGLYYLYDLLDAASACLFNATMLAPEEPRWRYLLAVFRTLQGRPDEALTLLDDVLKLVPQHLPSLIRKGRLHFTLGDYALASEPLARALEIQPNNAAALGELGKVEVQLQDAAAALPHLRRALELQPKANSLYYSLAQALRMTGDTAGAREAFAKNESGRLRFQDLWVAQIVQSNVSTEALFHAGNKALRAGHMEEAAGHFERYLASNAKHPSASYNLAMSYLQLGRREEALVLLAEVLEADPKARGGQRLMADALAEDGNLQASLIYFEKAHLLEPDQGATVADWATVLAKLGRVEEALEMLAPWIEPEKQEHYARLKYATILATSGRGDVALPILEDIVASSGLSKGVRSEAYYHLGSLELASGGQRLSGRVAAAQRMFEQSLELDPESTLSSGALAPLLAQQEDFDRAVALYQQVVAVDPEDTRAQFGLGMSLLLAGRDADAKVSLESAVEAISDDGALRHVLARLLATSEDGTVRDGTRALTMARRLLQQAPAPDIAETAAMALAETGAFEEAIALQQQVVNRSQQRGGADEAQHERVRRLELYQQGKTVRSPWNSSS